MTNREYAYRIFFNYLNARNDQDAQTEIEMAIDAIIDAAKEELLAELQKSQPSQSLLGGKN